MRRISIPFAALVTFAAVYRLAPVGGPEPDAEAVAAETGPATDRVYYPGCNAVRAAGAAPLYRGQPGYREDMDGDDDGIACEPHRTRYAW